MALASPGANAIVDKAFDLVGLDEATDAIMGNVGKALEDLESEIGIDDLAQGIKNAVSAGIAAEITGQDTSSAIFNATTGTLLGAANITLSSEEFLSKYISNEDFVQGIVEKYTSAAKYVQGLVDIAKDDLLVQNLTESQIKILTDSASAAFDG